MPARVYGRTPIKHTPGCRLTGTASTITARQYAYFKSRERQSQSHCSVLHRGIMAVTAGNPLYLPHETSALYSDISAYLRQSAPARLRGGQKTLYYFGRIRGNTCDNAAAMRYYIQAEKHITQNENLSISGRLLKFCNQTNNP